MSPLPVLRNYVGRGPVDVILKSSDCAQMIFGIVRKAPWDPLEVDPPLTDRSSEW